jgi:hypothetical protein
MGDLLIGFAHPAAALERSLEAVGILNSDGMLVHYLGGS